jgi:HAD superfamily hydrolase (TIGR01509 family)
MLKAVLLDIDGTLIQSNDAHAEAWSFAFSVFGYDVSPQRVLRWIGMGGDKVLAQVDQKLSEDREPGKAIAELREEIFLRDYVGDLRPTNGARELLERIGAEKLLRVVATSAKAEELAGLLNAGGIVDQIDLATTSDDAERSKPDPDIVSTALAKASCKPDEALYLGDTPYDVAAAKSAGVAIVALTCGGWDADALAGAEEIYRDPAQLLAQFDVSPFMLLRHH